MNLLGDASADELARWLTQSGKAVEKEVIIAALKPGTMLRVETESENVYLFQVKNPMRQEVGFYRHKAHNGCSAGYRGERILEPCLTIGSKVLFSEKRTIFGRTEEVTSITIID